MRKINTLVPIIAQINADFNKYKKMSREQIFTSCVNYKLNQSLNKYNEDLEKDALFLEGKEGYRVLKTLVKIQKDRDKEIILQNCGQGEE